MLACSPLAAFCFYSFVWVRKSVRVRRPSSVTLLHWKNEQNYFFLLVEVSIFMVFIPYFTVYWDGFWHIQIKSHNRSNFLFRTLKFFGPSVMIQNSACNSFAFAIPPVMIWLFIMVLVTALSQAIPYKQLLLHRKFRTGWHPQINSHPFGWS